MAKPFLNYSLVTGIVDNFITPAYDEQTIIYDARVLVLYMRELRLAGKNEDEAFEETREFMRSSIASGLVLFAVPGEKYIFSDFNALIPPPSEFIDPPYRILVNSASKNIFDYREPTDLYMDASGNITGAPMVVEFPDTDEIPRDGVFPYPGRALYFSFEYYGAQGIEGIGFKGPYLGVVDIARDFTRPLLERMPKYVNFTMPINPFGI